MNTRVILYGGIALLIIYVMSSETPKDVAKPWVGTNEKQSLVSVCLEEVIGFEAGIQAKLNFCDCVTQRFAELIDESYPLEDPSLKQEKTDFGNFFKEIVVEHSALNEDAYEQARALANYNPLGFHPEDKRIAVLMKRFNFPHTHAKLDEAYEKLSEELKNRWEFSYKACFQQLN